ncbi:phosphate signaling complex protein PhoU [Rhodopirellula sp. MGV]|uniref:phosphate signaling complex protein PhoU n=1 Tax=Rhodopirellula sp. MGV TaxID=2023130 RepID=UPI000B9670BD|nr:phosphate signaling complex protein PhoU [Rhodopirellula sp. MGV]OYP29880.1 phosphate transport system regulatory protein PhoU [Rhodopirellula sp. MGV]PNY33762.1 phosphate transport system regulatory protein PhoU [Rhodopirellula baltica]
MIARKSLEQSLEMIEDSISGQCDQIEAMIRSAYRGLCERCMGTADNVLAMEERINENEVQIEEHCLAVLALHQPVASDLRRTAAALKINADLERIADLALNLAERTESLVEFPHLEIPSRLTDMVLFSINMLRDAREAFLKVDKGLAMKVRGDDCKLDEMNRQVILELTEKMTAHPEWVSGYLHVFSASRIVERIGDHATNIAEDIEYVVDGEIHRHQ